MSVYTIVPAAAAAATITTTTCVCVTDLGDALMPLLAGIIEVPCDTSVAVGDDPFCRFISLRNSTVTTAHDNSSASISASVSVPAQGSSCTVQYIDS